MVAEILLAWVLGRQHELRGNRALATVAVVVMRVCTTKYRYTYEVFVI